MIRSKTVTTSVEFDEEDVLAFINEADVVQRLHIIKHTVERLTLDEFDALEEFLTTGMGAQSQDGKTMKLFRLLKQLKTGLESI